MTDPLPTAFSLDVPASAKLIYLALRDESPQTQDELVETTGLSDATVSRCIRTLVGLGMVITETGSHDGRGRAPMQCFPAVHCPECGKPCKTELGVKSHRGKEHKAASAFNVAELDPEDLGLDDDTPEPTEGLR
jgi:biotin operon repressor